MIRFLTPKNLLTKQKLKMNPFLCKHFIISLKCNTHTTCEQKQKKNRKKTFFLQKFLFQAYYFLNKTCSSIIHIVKYQKHNQEPYKVHIFAYPMRKCNFNEAHNIVNLITKNGFEYFSKKKLKFRVI